MLSLSQVEVGLQTCALGIPTYCGITETESKAVVESSSSKSVQWPCLEVGGNQRDVPMQAMKPWDCSTTSKQGLMNEKCFPSPLSPPLSHHSAETNPSLTERFSLKCINLISLSCQCSNWFLMYLPLLLSPSLPLPFYWYWVGLASISTVPFPAHGRRAEWDPSFNPWCSGSLAQCHSFTLLPGAFL